MTLPRIGFDATAAFTQGGGIGRYTRELLKALLESNQAYRFRIFSAAPSHEIAVPQSDFSGPQAQLRLLPLSPKWLYRIWYRLRLPVPVQLFTGGIDLFHSPDFVLPPVLGNVPTLLTVHDLSFAHFPETFTPALVNYLNRVVPWSVARAGHILADSESTKRDLLTLYGTPEEKISVLYSGVDANFQPVHDPEALDQVRERYSIGQAPFLFTVGTLQPRKNIQMLIRAFKPIALRSNYKLVIAGGKGWLYQQLLPEAQRQDLADRVHFIGFVDDADLPALYSAARVFVFPSIYEGFGLPILEAMACGTPVIASDASSLPEVTGEAGILLRPDDEAAWSRVMGELMEDSALRAKLREAGFRQARRFDWHRSAARLLEIYGAMVVA